MSRYIGPGVGYMQGFHGCDRRVAEKVLAGDEDLVASANNYDWLGHGIYFWEGNEERAKQWAFERREMDKSKIQEPYAIGAVIDLGHCFNLLQSDHLQMLEKAYHTLKVVTQGAKKPLVENTE